MVKTYTYFSPETPGSGGAGDQWSETIASVRLGSEAGYIDEAEVGAVGVSNVVIDDPDGDVGHGGDAIVGLKQFYVDEDACPAVEEGNLWGTRLWTGYITDRRYRRGEGNSLVQGPAREIDVSLVDVNAFLSFRVFKPEALDITSSFDRPAETDVERVAALLGVDFLSTTLFDLGYVDSAGGVDMDACDYSSQSPQSVLQDCAEASGRNFFVYYDEFENKLGLWYRNSNTSSDYTAALAISNDLDDVDDDIVFAPHHDAVLTRDPSRVVAGLLLPYDGGMAYEEEPNTSYTFGWRDAVAPSANVKTLAKAEARALRYLADHDEEDDRISVTVDLPAAKVTGLKAGQRVMVKFTHLPGYEDWSWARVLMRNVGQTEETSARYQVALELSPQPPAPSCPISLAQRILVGSGPKNEGSDGWPSVSITPTAGAPTLVIGVTGTYNHNAPPDSDYTPGASYTLLSTLGVSSDLLGVEYRAIASPSGSYTVDATYTPGFGGGASSYYVHAALAIETSATSEVQKTTATQVSGGGDLTFTLGASPMVGNILICAASGVGDLTATAAFREAGWTKVYAEHTVGQVSTTLIFAKCVDVGDGTTWNLNTSTDIAGSLSEWAIS